MLKIDGKLMYRGSKLYQPSDYYLSLPFADGLVGMGPWNVIIYVFHVMIKLHDFTMIHKDECFQD